MHDMTHLERLESESLHILRETIATAQNPVMLYSVGKDSAVLLHLARKAFFPGRIPFPLLHIDTGWKFRDMLRFRDQLAEAPGIRIIVHSNPEGVRQGINPFDHGSALHTEMMKTEALKQALAEHRFDMAVGGARRDEEISRSKERIFSRRTAAHRWDPKNQRPELWPHYNTRIQPGETVRVFPLSNWTELDIWHYVYLEDIEVPSLYFAAERPVVARGGQLIMVDDDRFRLLDGETVEHRRVRFRTLGCYPLTGAIESRADSVPKIIEEMLASTAPERSGRLIDRDAGQSMEEKKQEGYF